MAQSCLKKPQAEVTNVVLKDVGHNYTTYDAKLAITNPLSIPIPISEISYTFKSDNRELASGTVANPGTLKGDALTNLDVGMKVPHDHVMKCLPQFAGAAGFAGFDWSLDYDVTLVLVLELPIGKVTIKIESKGKI